MNKSSKKILSFVIAFIFCFALINPISFSAVNRKDVQVNTVNFAIAKEEDKNEIQDLTSNYLTKNEEHTHISSAPADCLHKQVCDICGEEFGKLGSHKIVTDYYQAPTCTKIGLSAGSHCSVCEKVIVAQIVLPKADHVDKNGDYKCDNCGQVLEHTHTSTIPADCLHKQVCDICGEEFGELGSHKIVTDYYQAPTCTKDGLTPGSHCSVCGTVIIAQRVIAKKGHTVVIDEAVPATCTEYGKSIGSHCSECGEILTKQTPTPKAPHTDNDNDNKCDVCGNKVTEDPIIEPQENKMPAKDIVLIVLSIVGFVVIFALVIAILKPKKKK